MVVIETDAARVVLDALDPNADGSVSEAVDAMAFQRDFYGTHLEDVDGEAFRRLLTAPERVPDHFALDALADGFRDAGDRVDELRERVDALEAMETEPIEDDVRRYLPETPALDATVHGVVDGFNGGFPARRRRGGQRPADSARGVRSQAPARTPPGRSLRGSR
ncbi:MAG: hypothetical protein ACI9YT_001293 [Halobacteriales archaeon]|jgi:hypothetical protein